MPGGVIRGTKGWVSPAGRLHAVTGDDETTVCGEPLSGLFEFRDVAWEGLQRVVRCPGCVQGTSGS